MKEVTLAELGMDLPIGILNPSKTALEKSFALEMFTLKHEKIIAREAERLGGGLTTSTTALVAALLTHVGDRNLSKDGPEEKRSFVRSMFWADVMYLYTMARVQSLGSELTIEEACQFCKLVFSITADLNTLQVKVVEKPDELSTALELSAPWYLREKTITHVKIEPTLWGMLEGKALSSVDVVSKMLQSSIAAISEDGEKFEPIRLTEFELDTMSKANYNRLNRAVGENNFGIDFSIETKCPSCGVSNRFPLRWEYESFFG